MTAMNTANEEELDLSNDYNVYSLWEGVVDDEESFDNLASALLYFDKLVARMKSSADEFRSGKSSWVGGDVTIHLLDTFTQNMLSETHISFPS